MKKMQPTIEVPLYSINKGLPYRPESKPTHCYKSANTAVHGQYVSTEKWTNYALESSTWTRG